MNTRKWSWQSSRSSKQSRKWRLELRWAKREEYQEKRRENGSVGAKLTRNFRDRKNGNSGGGNVSSIVTFWVWRKGNKCHSLIVLIRTTMTDPIISMSHRLDLKIDENMTAQDSLQFDEEHHMFTQLTCSKREVPLSGSTTASSELVSWESTDIGR